MVFGGEQMRRRQLLAALGGVTLWPVTSWAQQSTMPSIGFLGVGSAADSMPQITAVRRGLSELGFIEGKNVLFENRWADGHNDRLPGLASALVQEHVALIVTVGGTPSALAAKAATSVVPIVFQIGTDPVAFGLVASLNRPGGNLTGVTSLFDEVAQKRLALLHELLPAVTSVGLLVNPTNPNGEIQTKDLQQATLQLGLQLLVLYAKNEADLNSAFTEINKQRVGALLVGADGFLENQGAQIAALAIRNLIPTISFERGFPMRGGLMSYGGNFADTYRLAGVYAGRILRGERPADLPVQRSTKLELVINLKTARALGLDVPLHFQQLADEVIE
jgi:putative tryptophan/tyrosine transport system substrate-binding protein